VSAVVSAVSAEVAEDWNEGKGALPEKGRSGRRERRRVQREHHVTWKAQAHEQMGR
jgi:hypothetical protein